MKCSTAKYIKIGSYHSTAFVGYYVGRKRVIEFNHDVGVFRLDFRSSNEGKLTF